MKKIVSILLAFSIILSYVSTASAYEITVNDMRAYLISQGLPSDFIEAREDDEISEMYLTFSGQDIKYLGTEVVTMSEKPKGINTLGAIPESDMTFSITHVANVTYDSSKKVDRINMVYVYVDYIWEKNHPYIRWQDGITVNWDSNVFTFKSDSFVSRDYKLIYTKSGWFNSKTLTSPTELNQGGLGYYTNLNYTETTMGQNVYPTQHKGSAYFTLLPKKSPMYLNSGSYVTAINATYLHNKTPFGVAISFSHKGVGISMSIPPLSDSVAKATNVHYTV